MRRTIPSVIIILLCFSHSFIAEAQQRRRQRPRQSAKTTKAEPIRVLVRTTHIGRIGAYWRLAWIDLEEAADKQTESKQDFKLTSEGRISVKEETRDEMLDGNGERWVADTAWKLEPSAFDYVVNWEVYWSELSPLILIKIRMNESWKVEKIADPSVTKTWTIAYNVDRPKGSTNQERLKSAFALTKTIIAAERSPILREIRAFIEANYTKRS